MLQGALSGQHATDRIPYRVSRPNGRIQPTLDANQITKFAKPPTHALRKKKKIFDRTRKLNVPSTVMSIAFCYPDPPQVLLLELLQFSKLGLKLL